MFNRNSLVAVVSAASLATLSGAALAQQFVTSGGSSLPAPLYNDEIASFPASVFRSYVAVGSGVGKTAFLSNSASAFYSSGAVHWVGSESIMTQAQINDYLTTGLGKLGTPVGHGPVIQIPAMGTPVTISYKGPTGAVRLTKRQLCGVLSGVYVKWSELGVSSGAAPDSFKVIYRSDSSGTTELLTRHLQAVCGADSNVAFSGKSIFAQEFPGWSSPSLPAHFVGASGSAGVVLQAAQEASVIAYLGPDPIYASQLKQAELFNTNEDTLPNGQPNHEQVAYEPNADNVNRALGATAALPPGTGPVQRNPHDVDWLNTNNQGNPFNWIRSTVNPPSGYPIVGYTNFVLSQCYSNPAVTAAVKEFLTKHYATTNDKPAQHRLVPLHRPMRMRLLSAFVTGTSANLNVGNTVICGSYAGRG